MAKFSLLRLVTLSITCAVGAWLCLALVFTLLPSPPEIWDMNPTAQLSRGGKVTRVYDTQDFYSWNDGKESHVAVRRAWRSHFALDYRIELSPQNKTSWLHLNSLSIDLHELSSRLTSDKSTEKRALSYLSDPFQIQAKIGDTDGINLPSFRKADAMLLFWEIHRDSIALPLRLQVTNLGMELWPDSQSWDWAGAPPPGVSPLLQIFNGHGFNGTSVGSQVPGTATDYVSSSPSTTFPIRKSIQAILVPTGLFVYQTFSSIGVVIGCIGGILMFVWQLCVYYAVVVLVCWFLSGRPQSGPWAASFPLTRHASAKLRNVLQHWPEHDESSYETIDNERRPHPLRGPLDFFRSGNPLDDLLVTFESTKRFVEPIAFRRDNSIQSERDQVTSMPNEIKLDAAHRAAKPDGANEKESQIQDLEKGLS